MLQLLAALPMQEYWRYLLTGIPTVLLLGLFCRMLGRLITPFAEWVSFTGECLSATPNEHGTLLRVQFADTDHPSASDIQQGDAVKIALRAKTFAAGEYPDSTPEPIRLRSIYLAAEKNLLLRRKLGKELCIGMFSCGVAFALFYLAMQIFF